MSVWGQQRNPFQTFFSRWIVAMVAAMVAVSAFSESRLLLVEKGEDIRLKNRQSCELRFCGVDPAKGRVEVIFGILDFLALT